MIDMSSVLSQKSLLRLMQLSSASLPVGGYSFSQGLEYAIDEGWLKTPADIREWLALAMQESLANVDLPILTRLLQAVEKNDTKNIEYWNATLLACRETSELTLTETAMGDALKRLLTNMDIPVIQCQQPLSFIAGFAIAAHYWNIPAETAKVGLLWSWLENQIAAATKLVPLGQTQAQALLIELGDKIDDIIELADKVNDSNIGSSLPGLAMASSWHETQYSRLFRS